MSRLDSIRKKYPDERLLALPGVAKAQISAQRVFNAAIAADPTPQKKMVGWILESWRKGGFQWEDIRAGENSNIYSTLHDFDRLKRFIKNPDGSPDIPARSLMKYKTPGDLWRVVKDSLIKEQEEGETLSGKAQKAREKLKARVESYHKKFESGLVIDVPFTEFSSKINGRQTRWCTSADNDNMFEEYAKTGPLIIITLPTGEKYQYHVDIIETVDYSEIPNAIEDMEEDDETPDAFAVMSRIFQYNSFTFMDEADNIVTNKDRKILQPYMEDILQFTAMVSADMFGDYILGDDYISAADYISACQDYMKAGFSHFLDGAFQKPHQKEPEDVIPPPPAAADEDATDWFKELLAAPLNEVYGIIRQATDEGKVESRLNDLMKWTNDNREMLSKYVDDVPSQDPDELTVTAYRFVCSLTETKVPFNAVLAGVRVLEKHLDNPPEDKKMAFRACDILNNLPLMDLHECLPYVASRITNKKSIDKFSERQKSILRALNLMDTPYVKTKLCDAADVFPLSQKTMARLSHYAGQELPLDVLEKMAVQSIDLDTVEKIEAAVARVHKVMLEDDAMSKSLLPYIGNQPQRIENVSTIIMEQNSYIEDTKKAVLSLDRTACPETLNLI